MKQSNAKSEAFIFVVQSNEIRILKFSKNFEIIVL